MTNILALMYSATFLRYRTEDNLHNELFFKSMCRLIHFPSTPRTETGRRTLFNIILALHFIVLNLIHFYKLIILKYEIVLDT